MGVGSLSSCSRMCGSSIPMRWVVVFSSFVFKLYFAVYRRQFHLAILGKIFPCAFGAHSKIEWMRYSIILGIQYNFTSNNLTCFRTPITLIQFVLTFDFAWYERVQSPAYYSSILIRRRCLLYVTWLISYD